MQAGVVPLHQLVVGECGGTIRLFALVTVFRFVAGYKVVQVLTAQWVGLQREVLVGAEVIDRQLLSPGSLAGNTTVKEQDIRFQALCIENTGGQG